MQVSTPIRSAAAPPDAGAGSAGLRRCRAATAPPAPRSPRVRARRDSGTSGISGRRIPRISSADARNDTTSSTSSGAGATTASTAPPRRGTERSSTWWWRARRRSPRPTGRGRPGPAGRRSWPRRRRRTALCTAKPAATTCTGVSTPGKCATGTVTSTRALATSANTISRLTVGTVGEGAGDEAETQVRQRLGGGHQRGPHARTGEPVHQHRQHDIGDHRAGQRHRTSRPVAAEVGLAAQRQVGVTVRR